MGARSSWARACALRGGALQHEIWRYPATSIMQAAMVKTAPAATSAVHALMNISSNAATTASSTGSSGPPPAASMAALIPTDGVEFAHCYYSLLPMAEGLRLEINISFHFSTREPEKPRFRRRRRSQFWGKTRAE